MKCFLSILLSILSLSTTFCSAQSDSPSDSAAIDEVLTFYALDTYPVWPGCKCDTNEDCLNCFNQSMAIFLGKNLKYTPEAKKKKVEGIVYVSFVINENGKVTDVKSALPDLKLGYGLEEEAFRVIKSMPIVTPGKFNNKPVKVSYMAPIQFKLK